MDNTAKPLHTRASKHSLVGLINGCFVSSLSATIRPPFPSSSSSSSSSSIFSAIAVKPKLSLLSLPSTYTPLKGLKPSRSSTIRVFAAPEVLDSQETLDGPDSATTEVGGSVDPGSSPLSIGADAEKMAPKQKIRIKLRSYWVQLIEGSCKQITDAARTTSAKTLGPVPLPIKKPIYCVLKSPHVHKDARFHCEIRTHQRLIDILYPTAQMIDSLMQLDLPAKVDVEFSISPPSPPPTTTIAIHNHRVSAPIKIPELVRKIFEYSNKFLDEH
ncbi:hypothetical protein HYC85_015076 [Camellia sinensis]|uniref:Small ribosomal subunit protein uS10 domain-containing protein n=1 Tax=Camellia sinensis TaxID=4442 RepID=A0A7J7H8C2_CAMSI|nr:hypothetical protein HYC85_015076 [Camellia sinensis]